MFSTYDGYKKVETNGKRVLFAGANTAAGFVGLYNDLADERLLDRVYIIKGASGTGKSTFMKKTANLCEENGYSVERYLCGSDPASLDCVVIDGRIAILDGTSPHTRDMQYPGCSSEIVDLSQFWNSQILAEYRDEIISIAAQKTARYAAAYRYIKAADVLENERRACAESLCDRKKMSDFIDRLLGKLKLRSCADGKIKHQFDHGLTMRGRWCVNQYEGQNKTVYSVTDVKGLAPIFMSLLTEKLAASGKEAIIYHMPIAENISAVRIVGSDTLIYVGDRTDESTAINLLRFVKKDAQESEAYRRMKLAGKIEKSCLDEIDEILASVATLHFRLEEIYKSAMDFSSLASYTDRVTETLLERLGG